MKIMKYLMLTLMILIFPVHSLADGPSIDDNGNPTAPVVRVTISESQQKTLSTQRIITLTEQQMAEISPYWNIKTLGAVSENWNDCTCGMDYGFWTAPKEFAIPKYEIPTQKVISTPKDNTSQETTDESDEEFNFITYLKKSIIMDTEGNFYLNDTLLNISDMKNEYEKNKDSFNINVPSKKILKEELRNNYLKILSDEGIQYIIFG